MRLALRLLMLALSLVLALAACASPRARPASPPPAPVPAAASVASTHLGCDGARWPGAADVPRERRGDRPVGARTVELSGLTLEVWYPARPGSDVGVPAAQYDLRTRMPPAEAAKIPDADNAWLPCACARDLPVDDALGPLPVIVFLHGAASFRAQSVTLATHWASRGYVVVAPDLPGVGLLETLGGGAVRMVEDERRRGAEGAAVPRIALEGITNTSMSAGCKASRSAVTKTWEGISRSGR